MFIAQVFKYKHDGWRYLIGGLLIFTVSQLGQIPLIGAIMFKILSEGGSIADLEDPAKLMTTLGSNLTLFLMLLSFAIGLLGVYLVVKYLHNQPMVAITTTRKKIDWGRFFFGFSLIAVTTTFFTGLDYYNNPEDFEMQFQLVPFLILAAISIVLMPLQTSFEEYFFRGYLMQGIGASSFGKYFPFVFSYLVITLSAYIFVSISFSLSTLLHLTITCGIFGLLAAILASNVLEPLTRMPGYEGICNKFRTRFIPLLVTSFVFGGLHFFNPEVEKLGNIIMIYYIGTGLFLGIITLMDDGLELALGFHAGNNIFAALLVTADWTVFQTNAILKDISEPSAGIDVLAPVLILYPIFIGIMGYKYKWKDWGNKLFGRIEAPSLETEEITL